LSESVEAAKARARTEVEGAGVDAEDAALGAGGAGVLTEMTSVDENNTGAGVVVSGPGTAEVIAGSALVAAGAGRVVLGALAGSTVGDAPGSALEPAGSSPSPLFEPSPVPLSVPSSRASKYK
jgi:hypothetical protein